MKERVVNSIKKLWSLATAHYVLLLCLFAAGISFDLIEARYWSYNAEPAELLSNAVSEGLDHIAGAILLGAALLAAAINAKKKTDPQRPHAGDRD